MATKTVAQKAHVKPGTAIAIVNGAPEIVSELGLEAPVITHDPGRAKLVFVFVKSRAELKALMPPAAKALGTQSHLWVFFRKGAAAAGHDMNRDDVWAVAEKANLRPVSLLSVDETWSVFRFRRG